MSQYRHTLILLVAACCFSYVISQFLRNSIGVIAPDLSQEFGIDPSRLGLLSGVFFFAFGIVQLPLGICLDRFGARYTMMLCLGVATLACCLFAVSDGFADMLTARILMGLGCAPLLMGPMLLYSRWFSRERFAGISGFHLAVGNLGAIGATAPLAWAADTIGWRGAFWALALFSLLMAWVVMTFIRDAPPGAPPRRKEDWGQAFRGLREVLSHTGARRILPLSLAGYASFITLLGLWISPYLADVHGFALEARGDALLLISLAHACGILLWSPVDRWANSRKYPVLCGVAVSVALMFSLAVLPNPSSRFVIGVFVLLGAASAYIPVLLAHGRSMFGDHLTGRAITLFNMGNIMGVFLLQSLSGEVLELLLDASWAAESAYRAVFALLAGLLLLAGLVYASTEDRRPGDRVAAEGEERESS